MSIRFMVRTLAILLLWVLQSLFWLSLTHAAETSGFEAWLAGVRTQAVGQGISQGTVENALAGAKYLPQVIELYRNQPEFKLTLDEYLSRVVSENRILLGRKKIDEHRALLEDVYRRCRVEPRFLMAFWGIESDFGKISGDYPVIDAVATLAYASSRKDFYRQELFHALRILDKRHIPAEKMKGSWAGAMGQLQFMPSTFQKYAVDYNGDEKIDIWNDLGDAFVSAANYLSRSGWVQNQAWGMEVRLPKEFNRSAFGLSTKKPVSEWKAAGVHGAKGQDLLESPDSPASVIEPDPKSHRAFMVYSNYGVILKWNRSDFFAVAVGMLADQIGTK